MLSQALRDLADECGVLTAHVDGRGQTQSATSERLGAVLRALGVELEGEDEPAAARALAEAKRRRWGTLTEPCAAVFSGGPSELPLRVPDSAAGLYRVELLLESGESRRLEGDLAALPVSGQQEIDGTRWLERRIPLGSELPVGYQRARVEAAGRTGETQIISAPARAFGAPGTHPPGWGAFAPVYALRSERNLGTGDLGDLSELSRYVASLGGRVVGTLPLLSGCYDEPFEESPYAPISRLFWNELYLDVGRLASELDCPEGKALLAGQDVAREAAALRELSLVDYRRQMALKRRILEEFARWAWASGAVRADMEAFQASRPRLEDYARFRAELEARKSSWPNWPAPARDGDLSGGEGTEEGRRYHVFVQWALDRQLSGFDDGGVAGLYLDLPVGVSGASYDVWRERDAFVLGTDVGAPPDDLFSGGQNWALPPLHPQRQRREGYRYLIDCVRHHMRHAELLRIDHVMGLHRLYWIPGGARSDEGLYVSYPAEELYAIFSLESHKNGCAVAGEDLGTVPDYVRPEMSRRGFHRLYVAQFTDQPPPPEAVASLDTHDTATFAAFVEQAGLGGDPAALLREWTERLASSDAAMLLVTLEDLWLETRPQNVPGPSEGRPNWRRKMRLTLPEILQDEGIRELLAEVERRRKSAATVGGGT